MLISHAFGAEQIGAFEIDRLKRLLTTSMSVGVWIRLFCRRIGDFSILQRDRRVSSLATTALGRPVRMRHRRKSFSKPAGKLITTHLIQVVDSFTGLTLPFAHWTFVSVPGAFTAVKAAQSPSEYGSHICH